MISKNTLFIINSNIDESTNKINHSLNRINRVCWQKPEIALLRYRPFPAADPVVGATSGIEDTIVTIRFIGVRRKILFMPIYLLGGTHKYRMFGIATLDDISSEIATNIYFLRVEWHMGYISPVDSISFLTITVAELRFFRFKKITLNFDFKSP